MLQMNKIEQSNKGHSHSDNHHPQDNCEGCQQQRRENNMLVDFYERLNKIESKVVKIKDNVQIEHSKEMADRQKIQNMNKMLMKKPQEALKSIKQHDSKEMGYELASALIQREIKTKMQNQRLQGIIEQLQRQKLALQQQKHQPIKDFRLSFNTRSVQRQRNPHSRYSDVLDKVQNTNDSTYFMEKKKDKDMSNSYFLEDTNNKKFWEEASGQQQTNFSSFASPPVLTKEKSKSQNQYQGLNLWLYQFKSEEMDPLSLKSQRNAGKGKNNRNSNNINKSKF